MPTSNSGKQLTQKRIQQIFRAFQRNPNASFVARKLDINPKTVSKYIKSENMEERRRRILDMASDRLLVKQADQLMLDIMDVRDLRDSVVDTLIERVKSGEYVPSVGEVDKLQRLLGHLLNAPDAIVEHRDASIEVQRVKRTDILDLDTPADD